MLTAEAVKNEIRSRCVLQGGGLELNGLALVGGDALLAGATYSFVGGIPLGKSPLSINELFAGSSTSPAVR